MEEMSLPPKGAPSPGLFETAVNFEKEGFKNYLVLGMRPGEKSKDNEDYDDLKIISNFNIVDTLTALEIAYRFFYEIYEQNK